MGNNDFKQDYQTGTHILKDEKGDLVRDCQSILARWRNNFSRLLNVHGVNSNKQRAIYTAEPLVSDPRVFDFKIALEKLDTQITRY